MKLVVLYKQPPDPAAFDDHYFNHHLPLVQAIPGLQKATVTRFTRSLMGDGFYLMAEMHFADAATFDAAMKTPQMAATGEDANRFAKGLLTIMVAEEV